MKTVLVALLVFVLMLTGIGVSERIYEEQTDKIAAACQALYPVFQAGDKETATAKFSELRTAFYACEKWWSAVADHNRLESIEAKLKETENCLRVADYKGAENSLRIFCLFLENYQENMEIKWYNIL